MLVEASMLALTEYFRYIPSNIRLLIVMRRTGCAAGDTAAGIDFGLNAYHTRSSF